MNIARERRSSSWLATAAVLLLLGAAGCSHKPDETAAAAPAAEPAPAAAPAATTPQPVAVTVVTLGKAIGADKTVSAPTESFAKTDTIYASVATKGSSPSSKLTARWTYDGKPASKVVKEDSQTIAPTGDAVTEFHIAKPDGWPAGTYRVEILLDGTSAATKTFTVS